MHRLRQLDFLRGVAILLVLLRHITLFPFTTKMGWIGVDLFFVLSGFLVSGLLFKEYLKFGNIQITRFLIRRGFKIYPLYYIFYLPYLYLIVRYSNLNLTHFISDMTFTQNYVNAGGYAYAASWSLAVEEHFYFGFAILILLFIKFRKSILSGLESIQIKAKPTEILVISILVMCLLFRVIHNIFWPMQVKRNFVMTHLRIDSLFFGVLVGYLYYFKSDWLIRFFRNHKNSFYCIAILGLTWTPFLDPLSSFFVRTFGFTLLYLSFGILLIYFLLDPAINQKLNKLFTSTVVSAVSKIGYSSYSIYIIHSFVISMLSSSLFNFMRLTNRYLYFIVTATTCVLLGMLMTHTVERYFLRLRDKYYPMRA